MRNVMVKWKWVGVVCCDTAHFLFNQESVKLMDALKAIFTILYLFWPLLIFMGFKALFVKDQPFFERVRMAAGQIFIGWLVWAFFLFFLYTNGNQPITILSRTTDHVLFGILGAITGGVSIGWLLYRWRKNRIRLSDMKSLEDLLALSPEAFELLVAAIFRAYGHDAEVSGSPSDHGVDVFVTTNEGEKWIVQCKRYSGSVGEPVIRDLYGTMLHEGAQRAYLITTGSFTTQAQTWATEKPLVLYDGEALVRLIKRTQNNQKRLNPSI